MKLYWKKKGKNYIAFCNGFIVGRLYYLKEWNEWVWEQEENSILNVECIESLLKKMKELNK